MANNNYGPPPPMMNNQQHPGYYYPPVQQQQYQSERISGDGEEVYGRYGYNNFLRQPPGQGPPPPLPPPTTMMTPQPSSSAAGPPLPQQHVQGLGSGQGIGFGFDPNQQQFEQQQQQGNYDPSTASVPLLPQDRSVDGEEGGQGPPPPQTITTLTNTMPPHQSSFAAAPSSQHVQQQLGSGTGYDYDLNQQHVQLGAGQDIGYGLDSAFTQQQSQPEGEGHSNNYDDPSSSSVPPLLLSEDRSVDGEEGGQGTPPQIMSSSSMIPSMPLQQQTSSATVPPPPQQQGPPPPQPPQIINNMIPPMTSQPPSSTPIQQQQQQIHIGPGQQDNRSVDGNDDDDHHNDNNDYDRRQQPRGRRERDDHHRSQRGRTGGAGSGGSGREAVTLDSDDDRRVDGDDADDYERRRQQPRGRRERDFESHHNRSSQRVRTGGGGGAGSGREAILDSDDDRRLYEDDDDEYERRQQPRGRRDRDFESHHNRSSQRVRTGGGGASGRDREADRERSRREWETSRDAYSRPYRREYDFEDEHERPRSRSSYHDEEFYTARRRRRGEGEKPRGPPSEYNPTPHRGYPSTRDNTRSLYGYNMGYPPSANQFTLPFEPAPVTSQAQSFQMYLATFRTKSPAQYREWYHKYMAHMSDPVRIPFPPVPGYSGIVGKPVQGGTERSRPPSQSGGSFALDESATGLGVGLDDSKFKPIQENRTPTPARNTPLIFSTPHAIAKLTPLGYIVRNRYGNPNVDIVSIKSLMKRLPEYKEMKSFPGPLIKDITHKNTIVQFCQRKIRDLEVNDNQLDRENLILLWELLILLLRQNGSAIGSDIAELLLKSKSAGQSLDSDASAGQDSSVDEDQIIGENTRKGKAVNNHNIQNFRSTTTTMDDNKLCVDVFCQKLVYGHKREALDYAMDNALWGHALFFSSKMDEKLYGTVLARFANETMSLNSPLQTLYHVLSGKQPPSVTCCADESFGDWKPHLAMLLSNMGQRPEFEANTMRTLGRTLAIRKLKFAAQFCFLMAESEFAEDSDIGPLLGYNPNTRNVLEATQMTEIYEFARSLANPEFSLGSSFIESKFNYTKELINLGFTQEAYSYCEEMTKSLRKHRVHAQEQMLAKEIFYIAERLVNCDVARGSSSGEPTWMEELRKMADQLESETTSRKLSLATSQTNSDHIDDSSSSNNIHMNQMNSYINENNQTQQLQHDGGGSNENSQSIPLIPTNITTPLTTPYDNINSNQWHQQPPIQGYPYDPVNNNHTSSTPEIINNFQQQQPSANFQLGNGPIHHGIQQDNNNYWPSNEQPKFSSSGQQLGDHNFGANAALLKKKVVRFEDEELNGDSVTTTVQSLKARQLDNLTSKVIHEKSSKVVASHDITGNRRSSNNSFDRLNNIGSLTLRELKNLKSSSESHRFSSTSSTRKNNSSSSPVSSPIKFKSTFPIDQPISKSNHFNTFPSSSNSRGKKNLANTFPIDKECCDLNEPCDDHEDYDYLYDDDDDRGSDDFMQTNFSNNIIKNTKTNLPQNSFNEEGNRPHSHNKPQPNKSEKKSSKNDDLMGNNQQKKKKGGWLSGIFGSIIKEKNQMILPDDKEPTIVWDEATKSWKNTKGGDDEDSTPKGPPPTDSDLMGRSSGPPPLPPGSYGQQNQNPIMSQPNQQQQAPINNGLPNPHQPLQNQQQHQQQLSSMKMNGGPNLNAGSGGNMQQPPAPALSGPNKFQRPKGLKLRNNYVDVFNSNQSAQQQKPESPTVPLSTTTSTSAPINPGGMPNIFMPPPVVDSGPTSFLSEGGNYIGEEGNEAQVSAPPLFNPAQFQNQNIPNYGHNG